MTELTHQLRSQGGPLLAPIMVPRRTKLKVIYRYSTITIASYQYYLLTSLRDHVGQSASSASHLQAGYVVTR